MTLHEREFFHVGFEAALEETPPTTANSNFCHSYQEEIDALYKLYKLLSATSLPENSLTSIAKLMMGANVELNESLAELTGVVIGDGNLWTDGKYRYRVDINGNPKLDREYFNFLSTIIQTMFNRKTWFQVRPHELVLRTQSKKVFDFLTKELGLPYGDGKGRRVTIPAKILSSNWEILRCCIRGITDTDGSLFFARKKGYRDDYPTNRNINN